MTDTLSAAERMTKRERVEATLQHHPVDRCAILEQLSFNPTFCLADVERPAVTVRINGAVVDAEKVAVGIERTLAMTRMIVTLKQTVPPSGVIRLDTDSI